MMEYPPETAERDVWLDVLARSGSYPRIGRRLPSLLSPLGFSVDVFFFDRLENARLWRFDFLESLPITNLERERVIVARQIERQQAVSRLPCWLVSGEIVD